jgi:flagellar biosynthesis/type III secretory pathway protein FliH
MGHLIKGLGRVVSADVLNATEEAAQIRARAEAEAVALRATVQDEIEAARAAGFAAGREEGLADFRALFLALRARTEADLAASKDTALVLARRMAERIVGRAIDLAPELMNQIVAQTLASSRARSGKIVLRVHPADLENIAAGRPQWASAVAAGIDVRLLADTSVAHGGCVVDTPSGRVDARLQTQLEVLELALRAATMPEKDDV